MSYTFKTKVYGPDIEAEVEGTFTEEEAKTLNYPGCKAEFEIESIKIDDKPSDIYILNDETLAKIEKEAFAALTDDSNSHEPD